MLGDIYFQSLLHRSNLSCCTHDEKEQNNILLLLPDLDINNKFNFYFCKSVTRIGAI